MRPALSVFLSLLFSNMYSQNLLPNENALTSTFNIFTDTLAGTCFTVTENNNEYLVTVKHLFKRRTKNEDSVLIKVNVNNVETVYKGKIFFHSNPSIDLAILRLPEKLSKKKSLVYKDGPYSLGQECLFLGYPLFNIGSLTKVGKIPFVKKAIVSAFYEKEGIELLLLDGHNNQGFSGGPVITTNDKMENQFIIGVVSGYISQSQNLQINPVDKSDSLKYSLSINENSGIIIAYPTRYIIEMINNLRQQ